MYEQMNVCFIIITCAMAMLNFVSFNCNGLNDVRKLNCIFSLCNESFYDIICLQETFWCDTFIERIKRDKSVWEGEILYSNGINNRQGVAIMISKRFKNVFSVVKKESGRFIHIKGKVEDQYLNIYNIYAPNDINTKCTFLRTVKIKSWIMKIILWQEILIQHYHL